MYIMSVNNFPTRAGLASSASGFACLVACMAHALEVTADVSGIARLGSGSACRSMFGGFVEWRRGADPSGVDSIAHQLFNDTHWPELEILILVVNEGEKAVGSTPGMQASVKTSALLQQRVASIPQKIEALKLAIAARDFGTFAEITMKDSNQMHAVCLDTYPPLFYMNDTSRTIVDIVSQLNVAVGKLIAAYTFDAGPNAVVFCLREHIHLVVRLFLRCFPPGTSDRETFFLSDVYSMSDFSQSVGSGLADLTRFPKQGALSRIIHARVGTGPRVKSEQE
eukprot:TRINITY_DN4061_c0_g1_i1.p1 TRINITY_DN4061_c0_g1~~TRINITY_DN4061_c0_g1_i1.p1  ORF type:complete len:281 (+),score=44.68 TRINITY_DN4061_c0_g1_i1:376-1218(+)